MQWQTSATLLSQCSSNYNACGVKPVDSGSLCQYSDSYPAGTTENYLYYQGGTCCTSASLQVQLDRHHRPVHHRRQLHRLAAGRRRDRHPLRRDGQLEGLQLHRLTSYVDPQSLAAGWIANSSKAQWITVAPGGVPNVGGNGAGKNSLPSSDSTALSSNYDYTLTFTIPSGANSNTTSITWASRRTTR